MDYTRQELINLARTIAGTFNLDPSLVCALVENESSWLPNAVRFEEQFYEHYEKALKLPESEELGRSASYGLTQIMGQTAREYGFKENFRLLYDPEVNLHLGCQKLRRCLDLHGWKVRDALLAYNGGSDLKYPDRVLGRQPKYWAKPAGGVEENALAS